ncbi:MAG: hypothetical protein WCJ09_17585 [Planctomycetota bacterium]
MRFEVSNSTPPHLNRRLQLRMLGFVALIGVIMFIMTAFQNPRNRNPKPPPLPGSPDPAVFKVEDDPDGPGLKPDEFLSPPDNSADPDPDQTVPKRRDPWKVPGQETSPAESGDGLDQEIARLETTFDRGILRRVKDNTLGIRRDEADAYYRLVYHASRVNPVELERAGFTDVLYINLMTEPDRYRGEPISIQGELWRLYEFQAGQNEFGLGTLYEGWIFTADSDRNPYRVVFTKLPRELEPGDNLRKQVRVTGYFFKREGYPSKGGMHVTPTLIANRVVPYISPNAVPSTDAIVPYMIGLISAVGLAFLVTLVSFAISDRRAARTALLRELNSPRPSFEGIDAPPILSVRESLRQLEETEWKDETRLNIDDDAAAALHARDRKATRDHASNDSATSSESETSEADRRRNQAASVRSWTNRQNRNEAPSNNGRPAAETRSTEDAALESDLDQPVDEVGYVETPTPAAGNGMSKLAAWENEIQQLSGPDSRSERMTAEQRAAQAELRRDQALREQDLKDRLNHERAELDRNRQRQDDDEE